MCARDPRMHCFPASGSDGDFELVQTILKFLLSDCVLLLICGQI